MKNSLLAILLASACSLAQADGLLDFADPCVSAGKEFHSTAAAARMRADQTIQEWDARKEPPGEYRGIYVEAVREGAYKSWTDDPTTKALIAQIKAGNPNFDDKRLFLEQVYPNVVTPEKEAEFVRQYFQADYQANIRPAFVKGRGQLESDLTAQKSKYDNSCKPDVMSQVLRGTLGNAMSILGSNWSAAQNEKGELAKFYRATTGVSLTDIQKYGIRGGPNSELSKILGSDKSVASQLVAALDPTKWKVPLPSLPSLPNLPNLPNAPSPPPIKIGSVCIPWC